MIFTKISYSNDFITFSPIEVSGNVNYQYFEFIPEHHNASLYGKKHNVCIKEDIKTNKFSVGDGSKHLMTDTIYYAYICFGNNMDIDKILFCKEGTRPLNYKFYTKVNFVFSSTPTNNYFYKFSDAYIYDNVLIKGGWYGLTENNLYLNSFEDYSPSTQGKFKRKDDVVMFKGRISKPSAPPQNTLYEICTIPKGFRMEDYSESLVVSSLTSYMGPHGMYLKIYETSTTPTLNWYLDNVRYNV